MSKLDEDQLRFLNERLQELDFGSIVITVHEGKVTQIDTTEKKRFTQTIRAATKSSNFKRK